MAVRRGVIVVLAIIAFGVIVSFTGIALIYLLVSRGPAIQDDSTLVLRPGGELQETVPADVVGQLIARDTTTVRGFVESLRLAKRDPRITGVLLMPSSIDSPYWGKVQELRDAVLDFRKSGKVVVGFLEYGGDREYYLASAADRVFLLPTSSLDVTGIASYEVFLRGAFDKLGAYPDFLQIGDYKTAANQLTQKSFTPEHREMAESLNDDMYQQLVRGMASARKKTEAETRQLLDQGPFSPEDAVRYGLVDGLAYEDQLDDRVPQLRRAGDMRRMEGSEYQRVTPRSVGVRTGSRIAVLYASGVIASGKSGFDPGQAWSSVRTRWSSRFAACATIPRSRRSCCASTAPADRRAASDVIWRELMITRDQKPSRPLVVSMSDLAASGGYYIAMPAQVIVARAGHADRLDRHLRRQDRHRRHAGEDRHHDRTVKAGKNADHLLAVHAVFARAAREDGGYMEGFYRNFIKGAPKGATRRPRRSTRSDRDASGPARRRRSAGWSTRSAGSTPRSRSPSSARTYPGGRGGGAGGVFAGGAASTRRSPELRRSSSALHRGAYC